MKLGFNKVRFSGKNHNCLRSKGDFRKEMGFTLCCAGGTGFAQTQKGNAGRGQRRGGGKAQGVLGKEWFHLARDLGARSRVVGNKARKWLGSDGG